MAQQRQLTLAFDYAEHEMMDIMEPLEECATTIASSLEDARVDGMTHALKVARGFAEAKQHFKQHGEGKWADWCKGRLEVSRSAADKACQVHKVFGKKKPEAIAGLPVSRLAKLAQDQHKGARAKVLKLAKTQELTPQEVDAMLASNGDEEGSGQQVSFQAAVPSDHDELRAYLDKKITNLEKRIEASLVEELPAVLRELADARNGK